MLEFGADVGEPGLGASGIAHNVLLVEEVILGLLVGQYTSFASSISISGRRPDVRQGVGLAACQTRWSEPWDVIACRRSVGKARKVPDGKEKEGRNVWKRNDWSHHGCLVGFGAVALATGVELIQRPGACRCSSGRPIFLLVHARVKVESVLRGTKFFAERPLQDA